MDHQRSEALRNETEPDALAFADDERTETVAPAIIIDAEYVAALGQLIAADEAIEPLPRERAPRSTVDLDEEVTEVLSKPG